LSKKEKFPLLRREAIIYLRKNIMQQPLETFCARVIYRGKFKKYGKNLGGAKKTLITPS